MARLLVLTPQLPYPPRQGTALRNWGILHGLAGRHKVDLLSFMTAEQGREISPLLAGVVRRVEGIPQPVRHLQGRLVHMIGSTRPDLAWRLEDPTFRARLRAWLQEVRYDWVVIEGLELAPYMGEVLALPKERRPRVIFDDHNCEYLLQQRAYLADRGRPARWAAAAYSLVQWRRLQRYEAAVCRQADLVMAVSAADAAALQRIAPTVQPLVLPNGIHVAEYADFAGRAELMTPAFVFTGTLDFRPNVDGLIWFLTEVWPQIRTALPEAQVYLVGRRPHARLAALAGTPGVVLTGPVPDTRPFIGAATVYVAPLLVGGGTRLKLLEAMSMSRAIVATTLGAEGFPEPERALVLADAPADFAAACVRLAQDGESRAALGAQARSYVADYDWARLLPPLFERLG